MPNSYQKKEKFLQRGNTYTQVSDNFLFHAAKYIKSVESIVHVWNRKAGARQGRKHWGSQEAGWGWIKKSLTGNLSMQPEQSHYLQNSPVSRNGMCPATSSSSTVLRNLTEGIVDKVWVSPLQGFLNATTVAWTIPLVKHRKSQSRDALLRFSNL